MKFAKVINGVIEGYPEFDSQPECKVIDGKPTIRPVVENAKPPFDPVTQELRRQEIIQPTQVVWNWVPTALSAQQIAANQRNKADADFITAVTARPGVQALMPKDPAAVIAQVDAITTLDELKALVKEMLLMQLVENKRIYRQS